MTMEWISVHAKLPSGNFSEIVTDENKHISQQVLFCNDICTFVGFYDKDSGEWYADEIEQGNRVSDVTHWQHLPVRPKRVLFKPPFRVGKKQGRAVLDANGLEVVVFGKGLESYAKEYAEFLNLTK